MNNLFEKENDSFNDNIDIKNENRSPNFDDDAYRSSFEGRRLSEDFGSDNSDSRGLDNSNLESSVEPCISFKSEEKFSDFDLKFSNDKNENNDNSDKMLFEADITSLLNSTSTSNVQASGKDKDKKKETRSRKELEEEEREKMQ